MLLSVFMPEKMISIYMHLQKLEQGTTLYSKGFNWGIAVLPSEVNAMGKLYEWRYTNPLGIEVGITLAGGGDWLVGFHSREEIFVTLLSIGMYLDDDEDTQNERLPPGSQPQPPVGGSISPHSRSRPT